MNGSTPNPFPPEPSPDFLETVLARIAHAERQRARRRLVLLALVSAFSVAGLIPAYQVLQTELAASGFIQLSSLLFSDPEIVLVHWQDFALSLLELTPVTGFIAMLASLLVLLGSLRASAREFASAFSTAQHV